MDDMEGWKRSDQETARKRNANIIAEIIGYGASADAFHLTSPNPDGIGAQLCMQFCLDDAKILPSDINYINCP